MVRDPFWDWIKCLPLDRLPFRTLRACEFIRQLQGAQLAGGTNCPAPRTRVPIMTQISEEGTPKKG